MGWCHGATVLPTELTGMDKRSIDYCAQPTVSPIIAACNTKQFECHIVGIMLAAMNQQCTAVVEGDDTPSFRTGASADNVFRPIAGLQRDQ